MVGVAWALAARVEPLRMEHPGVYRNCSIVKSTFHSFYTSLRTITLFFGALPDSLGFFVVVV